VRAQCEVPDADGVVLGGGDEDQAVIQSDRLSAVIAARWPVSGAPILVAEATS
jgi:hypothetical protein